MISNLSMYVAPQRVVDAQVALQQRVAAALKIPCRIVSSSDYVALWCSDDLLLSQTCGYPLVTSLRGKVKLVGKPSYSLRHSALGSHCSLIVCRADASFSKVSDAIGAVGLINSMDSNSGMNLFRHTLSKHHSKGFFSDVKFTGGHISSLQALKDRTGDLASIDSVTYDYLAREKGAVLQGLKILAHSVQSPCLPYITSVHHTDSQVEQVRVVMNKVLQESSEISRALMISEVLPADVSEYQALLELEEEAGRQGFVWSA